MNEKIITTLLKKASKNNGTLTRRDFDEIVSEEEQNEVEKFLKEKDIFVIEEEVEELPENVDFKKILPRKYVNLKICKFLEEISVYKRLSTEEEKMKLNIIKKGKKAQEILDKKKDDELTEEEIKRLSNLINEGERERQIVIYSYHTFVLSWVIHYVKHGAAGSIDLEELIQAGFTGLIDALNSFDFSKEVKLATWAGYYVKNAIQALIASSRNAIAIPKTAQYNRMKIVRIKNQYELKNGKTPTAKEIALEMGEYANEKQLEKKIKSITNLLDSSKPTVNLDDKISTNENENETYDKIIPSNFETPLEKFIRNKNNESLYQMLSDCLNERELYIIYHRHGINCDSRHTLEEIGKDLGLTRERVRQIEADIYNKLKNGKYAVVLAEMLSQIRN